MTHRSHTFGRPRTTGFTLAAACGWALAGCGGEEPPPTGADANDPTPPRPVILITIDTLRADHVGAYGYFRDTTPHLDALAEESVRFERCVSPIAHTTPSHLSLLTGVYPLEHGMHSNLVTRTGDDRHRNVFVPSDTLKSFAQHVQARDWPTAAFVSATPTKRATGLAAGFETWSEPEGRRRSARESHEHAFPWFREIAPTGEAFFAWLHYFDPHGPYDDHPPEEYAQRFADDDPRLAEFLRSRRFPAEVDLREGEVTTPTALTQRYDGAIRYFDDQLGELFDELRRLGLWDRAILVVTSDHGQGLGQHDFVAHGTIWDEQLRVPLFIRWPDGDVGVDDTQLSLIDVLPTAVASNPGLVDEAFFEQARGRDVRTEGAADVFGMSQSRYKLRTLIDGDWKYVEHPKRGGALYDLSRDPFELRDQHRRQAAVAQRLEARLASLVETMESRHDLFLEGVDPNAMPADPDMIRELQALGYVTDGSDDDSTQDDSGEDDARASDRESEENDTGAEDGAR